MENIETLLAALAQTQGFDDDEPVESPSPELGLQNSIPSTEIRGEMGRSQQVGDSGKNGSVAGKPSVVVNHSPPVVVAAASPVIGAGEKRRRGRPPRGSVATKPPPPKRQKQEDEEEDVCFICFDGGSLVLCDRKGCPKAYHPACIKRDESFFQSKAKWNCGWHICSVCQKTSHYMCYTCTYSLCKGCTRDEDYVLVRGNKGFCTICMKTIMLIENKGQANSDSVQVDFDDQSSWEYLFKWYWMTLKEKLSLTLIELTHAKKPWKGAAPMASNLQMNSLHHTAVEGKVSVSCRSSEHLELNKPCEDCNVLQNDRLGNMASDIDSHVKAPNSYPAEDGPSHNKDIEKPSSNDCHFEALNGCSGQDSTSHIKDVEKPRMDRVIDEPRIDKNSDMPGMDKVIDEPINPRGSEEPRMVKVTEEPRMEKVTEEPSIARDSEKPRMDAVSDKPRIGGDSDVRQIAIDANEPSIARDSDNPGISSISTTGISIEENRCNPCLKDSDMPNIAVEDLNKPGICRTSDTEPEKTRISCSAEWASKDLLEFVAHVKNGDTSALSHFDVQNLLLDYIKRNNLRDPRKKSQIVCDLRLKNLFGKARVGHIEMLKLLEFHFLGLEDSHKNSFIPAGFVAPAVSPMEIAGKNCGSTNSRKRKSRKRSEERTPQNNINEYAAIDVHNINLIYLRRNLMENLIENERNFNDKVIGSIVRIRISSENQKPDVHRLVQVLGISKVAKLYKVGDKTTDRMLEVLNLDKKEVVSIDAISSQDFTEDECRRLRQSIRCGLAKLFTVGDIQRKAMQLQSVRINDWLESEILRLTHLRDRASEKGHKKELREYLEKIQLLKSPEERQRRISEVPEIHADPKMNPDYESEVETRDDDDSKSDVFLRSKYLESARNESRPNFPNKKGKLDGSILSRDSRMMGNADASTSQSFEKHVNQVIPSSSRGGSSDQTMPRSGLETSRTTTSIGNASSSNNIETEKLWHYRDPNGKIQGPFSMIQLRKWSTTGLFPPEMRIWTNHEQYDSLLLTDALNGQFHGAPELSLNPSSEPQEHGSTIGTGVREDIHMTGKDIKQSEAALCEKSSVLSDKDTEIVRSDESGSSSWPQCWDLLKDKDAGVDDVQPCIVPPPSSPRKTCVIVPSQDRERDEFKHVPESGENNSSVPPAQNQMSRGPHLQTQFSEVQPGLTSDENLRSLPVDLSLNNAESEFAPEPLPKSPDSVEQRRGIDISDLPSPTPQTSDKQWILQNAEKQECASPDVPVEHIGFLELLNPTPKSTNGDQEGQATETKQSGFMNFLLPNSDPGWSGASSLVGDDIQLPEIADEWCGFSPTSAKRSVQEWHACLVSDSSIKPPEVTNQIPPVSNNDQLSHPMPNMPSWLDMLNEPIELDALGEESVSDLLAEVDLLESQCGFPSPTSSIKFAKELNQDCKDDCFSSIEFSHTTEAGKSDAFSSTGEIQLMSHSSVPCKPIGTTPVDAFDCVRQSTVHSSASSEAETNTPVFSGDPGSEFHPHPNNTSQDVVGANIASSSGLDCTDPGWGTVQGNINLVTVQGNVNLVLGGPGQGMPSLNWGNNPGTAWVNPNMNRSPLNVSLPWDGQRKYSVERYTSPRERGYQGGEAGVGRGRLPWGRQPYNGGGGGGGGGGYSRPIPKGQRVCKFYESGHCKKGAFCDYLHP